ncbi:FimV/HubP family polar landmark protein [Pseudaeromonas sharmana]|uniref:FimV/HubP family polar landmark protein n=1 Tax=Pseudaeromonas sharmana TaxID=328412 RepID=A0ABV8CQS1_9GAMM
MGLHFSRLALAIALSIPMSVPLMAADQLDEFYIEIKGPDKPVSPLIAPTESEAPTSPSRQVTPAAKPVIKQTKPAPRPTVRAGEVRPFVSETSAQANAGTYGPVKSSDTLWSIAQQIRPSNQVSVYQTLLALYRKNPKAFAGGRLSGLYRGSYLQLPTAEQIRSESETVAQELVRKGSMTLPKTVAPKATVAAAPAAEETASTTQKVVKLSPPVEEKPVVKLTPANPKLVDSRVVEVAGAQQGSEISAATTTMPATSAAVMTATEQVGSEVTIAAVSAAESTAASAAVVVAPATDVVATAIVDEKLQAMQRDYKNQIDTLTQDNSALKDQLGQMEKELQSIKAMLAKNEHSQLETASSAVSAAEESQDASGTEPSMWDELTATPLNLALLLLLPFLLALALISLWLMARSKREQAAREYDESDSADGLMDGSDSHFDHLLAADMVTMNNLPDLEQQDETVQPQPEIILDEERAPPTFTTASSFTTTVAASTADPELLPEFSAAMGDAVADHADDLDLSIPATSDSSSNWNAKPAAAALDEAEFLSELGIGDLDNLPEDRPLVTEQAAPLQPEKVVEQDAFVPRETVNLSNDELDALFDSVDDLTATETVQLDESEPDSTAQIDDADTVVTEVAPAPTMVTDSDDIDSLLAAHQPAMAEEAVVSLEEQDIKASLAQLDEALNVDSADELPPADWYQEENATPAATVSNDDIDALLNERSAQPAFRGIDELLAEADASESKDEPYEGLSLDVGLDEFPEVLPDAQGIDVDVEGELGAKLDLARAYLEIDDKASASELLNEVLHQGNNEQRAEAQRLLKRLS